MALPTVALDDRKFQDIVDEAKKRIKASCPEWTDHNVSDPGVTLIELFAWMTDMILYRLNQVPEKNYVKFMELMGLRLREPESARTALTFYLSAPQPQPIIIPVGTEVATVRTETRPAIVFSTDLDLEVRSPQLFGLFTREMPERTADKPKDRKHVLQQLGISSLLAFGKQIKVGNGLYFGFANDMSDHVLGIEVECPTATGRGIDPTNPPWKWEGWHGGEGEQRWQPVAVAEDRTGGMSYSGRILLRVPRLAQREFGDQRGFWLRCQVAEDKAGRNYDESPIISNIKVSAWGGTVLATNASIVHHEFLGRSDGSPGQIFQVEHVPLLRRGPAETVEVQFPGHEEWEAWIETPDLGDSGSYDKHFTCDSTTGDVRFGPALRERDGHSRSYGAIPPRGARIRFGRYRYGGGIEGNVRSGELSVLKSSIPYVDRVTNHNEATGGLDAETVDMAKDRAPSLLRSRGRAVTAADYEAMARAADSRVERARCVQSATAGQVYVLVTPKVNHSNGRITPEQLKLSDDLHDSVNRYLDDFRLLTVLVDVRAPEYAWVSVEITVTAAREADAERVRAQVEQRLYGFLNPIVGGHQATGWAFGRALYASDVYACLREVRGIEYIESMQFYRVQPQTGDRSEITGRLDLPDHALVASAEHVVKVSYSR